MRSPRINLSAPGWSSLLLVVLLAIPGRAQDAFFHRGAQHFLSGSNQLAKAEVERGLQTFPEDPHLKKFWELLNQQSQNQDNQDQKDQKDQKDDKDKKDQNDQKDSKQDKDKQDSSKDQQQDKPDKDKDKKDSQGKDQKPKDDPQQQKPDPSSSKDGEKKDGQEGQAGQPQKGEETGDPQDASQARSVRMTPQQAVRLLEAIKGEERTLQFKPVLRTNRTDRILKDW